MLEELKQYLKEGTDLAVIKKIIKSYTDQQVGKALKTYQDNHPENKPKEESPEVLEMKKMLEDMKAEREAEKVEAEKAKKALKRTDMLNKLKGEFTTAGITNEKISKVIDAFGDDENISLTSVKSLLEGIAEVTSNGKKDVLKTNGQNPQDGGKTEPTTLQKQYDEAIAKGDWLTTTAIEFKMRNEK